MTSTSDPLGIATAVLDELRGLRKVVELGITSTNAAAADVARVEAKSNQRARRSRNLWIAMAAVLAAFIVIATTGYYVNEAHRRDDDARRQCFQVWANRTANRSQTLTAANDVRIRALNNVLAARAANTPEATYRELVTRASRAGDAYEQVARENPPIPPSTLTCAD